MDTDQAYLSLLEHLDFLVFLGCQVDHICQALLCPLLLLVLEFLVSQNLLCVRVFHLILKDQWFPLDQAAQVPRAFLGNQNFLLVHWLQATLGFLSLPFCPLDREDFEFALHLFPYHRSDPLDLAGLAPP